VDVSRNETTGGVSARFERSRGPNTIGRSQTMGSMLELTASDGHSLSAYRADPDGTPRGAIVVVQEVFGVNDHVRGVCEGYAALARRRTLDFLREHVG